MNRSSSRRWLRAIITLSLCLFLSTAACKRPATVYVPLDTNIQRIIEARDFDSLLACYFQALGQARFLELKLRECEKGKK
jgi:hypothetical protein